MTARSNQQDRQPEQLSFRQYAGNVRLLRRMPCPETPAELQDPAFLEAIYERAVDASGAQAAGNGPGLGGELGTVLRDALPPLAAPEEAPTAGDVVAEEAADQPGLAAHFATSRNGTRAPGWLWQRIRAKLFPSRHHRHLFPRHDHLHTTRSCQLSPWCPPCLRTCVNYVPGPYKGGDRGIWPPSPAHVVGLLSPATSGLPAQPEWFPPGWARWK